jgi:hypothetical protein
MFHAISHLLQSYIPLLLLQPKLTHPDPGYNAHKHEYTRHNNSPVLNMRHLQAVIRPRRRANRGQTQCRNNIARHSMILVDTLRVFQAAIQLRNVGLCKANNGLDVYEDVECKSETRVCGFEVFVARAGLVHLDDDKTRGEGCCAADVEEKMRERAGALLFGGVGRLHNEGCLDGEEKAGLWWRQ